MSYLYKTIEDALNKLQGAYAPNTLKSYYSDARAFVDWCGERNIEPFPIASETLRAYIEYLQGNSAYSTIRRRISSLRRLNKMLGFEDRTRTEEVYLAIRRLKRSKCLEQNQAVGIKDLQHNFIGGGYRNRTGVHGFAMEHECTSYCFLVINIAITEMCM
jgi:site-specific recombinase XerD